MTFNRISRTVLLLALLPLQISHTAPEGKGFRALFNGKDLDGWDGNPDLWSVEDGVIVGQTTDPKQLAYNQFLIWRGGSVKNFELRMTVRVKGNNSGIQYRSKELPKVGKWSIGGYQCDIHPTARNNAMAYEERGRGIVALNGQEVMTDGDGRRWLSAERETVEVDVAEWHEYTVIARGNHLVHKVDGKVTAELWDFDEKARSLEGLLAVQIHRGPPMKLEIKDVRLKELKEGGLISAEKMPIPSDAQEIGVKKPAEEEARSEERGEGRSEGQRKRGNACFEYYDAEGLSGGASLLGAG